MIVILVTIILIILIITSFYVKETFNTRNNSKRDKLMKMCGLPTNYDETSHCFADGTHQTCCMLGPEARKYADKSGNPIGKASELANNYYRSNTKMNLKPWCTCFGSKVCSYYSQKFNDGTYIKFVNNPSSSDTVRKNIYPECEGYFRDKFSIKKHGTPGINESVHKNNTLNCSTSGNNFILD